jgi:peptidase E
MKLFLASSACFVSDVLEQHIDFSGKCVGCICNAADEDGGKDAWWNQRDMQMLESKGAVCVVIDLRDDDLDLPKELSTCDILFVGGGDTMYVAALARKVGLRECLEAFFVK